MRTLILALVAATVLAGCAAPQRPATAVSGAPGTYDPNAAGHLGYHGPVWRQNAPSD